MKTYLILAAFVGVCVARPDIGLKLRQQGLAPPATNYGVPVGYLPPTGGDHHSGSHQHSYYESHGGSNQQGGNFGSGQSSSGQSNFGSGSSSGHSNFGSGQSSSGQSNFGSGQSASGSSFDSTHRFGGESTSNFGGSSESGISSSGGSHFGGSTEVSKHIYFFDAPEDLPAPVVRINQQRSAAKKNYQIVFIKAPSYKAPQIQIPSAQELNSQKTLVYVLVKKPEDVQNVELPSAAVATPSKPEVFFIKYKNKQDAQQKINHIQNGGSGEGIVSTDLGSDASFVSTINDNANKLVITTANGGTGTGHDSSFGNVHHSGAQESTFGGSQQSGNHGFEHDASGTSGSHQETVSGPYKK